MLQSDTKDEELHYPNGDSYIGGLVEKKRDGFGVYTSHFGDKYIGNFKKDCRNGLGLELFNDSEEFFGEWKNNLFNGKGKYTFSNGDIRRRINQSKNGWFWNFNF